ncbi:MAG: glutamine amidotransferase [Acidobacteriota bacterium]|nr:glutamine amidotransferase [Acidobacteriota bacterium]MDE3043350.1 glutamine amidotransferase [Acidobacteriota bacterium]MDE3106655.1 glutamine amidotransferase [Acidobacteriota bacterium]
MIRVATLLPELLGTYGDGGNAVVMATRARRRGFDVELIEVGVDDPLPDANLFLLGGGEDGPQRHATEVLHARGLAEAYRAGAHVLAVCAGLQILGTHFCVEGDDRFEGLGLVDAVTTRGVKRSVGELAVLVGGRHLVGFENHGGVTTLGEGVAPLGRVVRGRGSDGDVDGFRAPRLWATYAHGPVLALNPWFADEILASVVSAELAALPTVADQLYAERLRALGL